MNLTEKVAYIKGLMEGLKLDASNDQVKVLSAVVDLLEDLSLTVSDLEDSADETAELLDVLDEDLGSVEEFLYGEEDGCSCGGSGCHHDGTDGEEVYQVTCGNCGTDLCITEEALDEGGITCPNCGESLELSLIHI